MTHDTTQAAERLAAVMTRENAALAALDLRRAAAMLAEKQEAAAAFVAAQASAGAPSAELTRRLRDLAQDNRVKLEHAIAVQRRIISMIARAIRDTAPAPRYGATGAMAAVRTSPYTLSARA
jgi:hypothetical protein